MQVLTKPEGAKFACGHLVRKIKGGEWHGVVVGFYSTPLTPIGYAVESIFEQGSVQIYPEAALEQWLTHDVLTALMPMESHMKLIDLVRQQYAELEDEIARLKAGQ